jgi:hypothetical protein
LRRVKLPTPEEMAIADAAKNGTEAEPAKPEDAIPELALATEEENSAL